MEWDKWNEYLQIAVDKAVFYLPRIILAGVILWIGFKIVKKLVQMVGAALQKTGFSETLRPFLSSTIGIILKGAVLFVIASILGGRPHGVGRYTRRSWFCHRYGPCREAWAISLPEF